MEKKVLIIGGINPNFNVYTKEEEASQAANSRWMWNLIDGFEANGFCVTVLNAPNIPSYQEQHKRFVHKAYDWSHNGLATDYAIRYLNFLPISLYSRDKAIKKYCKKYLKDNKDSYIVGITPHFPIVNNIAKLTKKGYKSCLILPDLPDYTGKSRMHNAIYRFLKNIDVKRFYKKIVDINKFVLLTEQMKEKIDKNKESCIVECIANEKMSNTDCYFPDDFVVAYTGTVHDNYGIYEVACAIHDSNLNVKFIICGDGTGLKKIKEDFENDKRFIIKGSVSPEESIEIQKHSSILINPRPSRNEEYLKYSFPSKTVEYMLASKPVICFKLKGIPNDYDKYLDYLDSLEKETIIAKIEKYLAMSKEELIKIGEHNRKFVLKNKNSKHQVKKIIDLLEGN